jgi:hypothetical protein
MNVKPKQMIMIVIELSESEARAMLNDMSALRTEIGRTLRDVDARRVSQQAPAAGADRRNGNGADRGEKPARPKGAGGKSIPRRKPAKKECPMCHEMKSPLGFQKHVDACRAKSVLAATSSPTPSTLSS